jgi:hypothetical protein
MSPNLPHILCSSEHHLKHTELDEINIEGFKLYHILQTSYQKGRGLYIYSKGP